MSLLHACCIWNHAACRLRTRRNGCLHWASMRHRTEGLPRVRRVRRAKVRKPFRLLRRSRRERLRARLLRLYSLLLLLILSPVKSQEGIIDGIAATTLRRVVLRLLKALWSRKSRVGRSGILLPSRGHKGLRLLESAVRRTKRRLLIALMECRRWIQP